MSLFKVSSFEVSPFELSLFEMSSFVRCLTIRFQILSVEKSTPLISKRLSFASADIPA
jgi:hypothetical protein